MVQRYRDPGSPAARTNIKHNKQGAEKYYLENNQGARKDVSRWTNSYSASADTRQGYSVQVFKYISAGSPLIQVRAPFKSAKRRRHDHAG